MSPRLSNRALQPVEKKRAVREIGQAIVEGQVFQLFLGPLPLCNVAVHDNQPFSLAFRAANSTGGRLDKAPGTIFVSDAIFEPLTPAGAASFLGSLEHTRAILRMNLIHRRSGCQFFGAIS